MARTKLAVDKDKLIKAVQESEEANTFTNLNALHRDVADRYNKMEPPIKIEFPVVMLRIKEWEIITKTKPSKRGREKGWKAIDTEKDIGVIANSEEEEDLEIGYENMIVLCDTMRIIQPDRHNLILQIKKGEEWAFCGYFNRIYYALEKALQMGIPAGTLSANALIKAWKELTSIMLAAVEKGPISRPAEEFIKEEEEVESEVA